MPRPKKVTTPAPATPAKSYKDRAILVNLSPWPVGGFTSVTAHAWLCLHHQGWDVQVLRVSNKTETRQRLMALTVPYRNVTLEDLLAECIDVPTLVTGVARTKDLKDPETIAKLLDVGAKVVVHGYTEHKQFQHLDLLKKGGGVCVRRSMCGVYEGVHDFLPHPYFRQAGDGVTKPAPKLLKDRRYAGSVAMVVPHKHPEIILEANRLLSKEQQVVLHGNEDRLYTKHKLSKLYPEYTLHSAFPKEMAPTDICAQYRFIIDLTVFGAGNGGTQYSFLEAMDAGSVLVIHRDWLEDVGDMLAGINCLAISTPLELASLLKDGNASTLYNSLAPGYSKVLEDHGPVVFSQAFKRLFL